MAKHLKAAVKAVIQYVIISTIGASLPLTKAARALKWTQRFADAMKAVHMVAAMAFVASITQKGIEAVGANYGAKFAARAPTEPRQLVYGECRIGGTIVHMETTGVDNYLLHMVVVLAGHEIQSLESIRLNDIDLSTSSSTISGSTVYTVTNAEFTNTDNDNAFDNNGRLIRYTFVDGSQTAVDGYMDAQLSSITTSDKFLDCAYVYIQMVFDSEKFGGGMPAASFKVKGKKVYDPRDSSTAFSSNPALCIRDYIANTTYGLKALSSEINDTTNAGGFASAANICDQDVTLADGSSTEKRYTLNGFTNFSASGSSVLEGMLSSMVGKVTYVNGKFNLFAGAAQTPSLTITDDDLLSPVSVDTKSGTGALYNTVKPTYIDAANNYIAADAPVYQDATYLTEDTPNGTADDKPNYVKQMELRLPFTTTHTMAQRIGRIALKSQRKTQTISCMVGLEFMQLQPADWVYVTNSRLSYSSKVFEVVSVNLEIAGEADAQFLATELALKEVESAFFTFATSDYASAIAQGSDLAIGGYAMAAPSNLAVATDSLDVDAFNMTSVTVSWTNSASPLVNGTEVQYKKNSGSTYFTHSIAGKGVTSVNIAGGMEMGVQYNFRIRHVGASGTSSSYTSVVNHTVGGTAVATSAITNSTVNYSSDGTGTLTKAKGGFGEDISSKTGAISISSGTFSFGTLPASIGGTGLTSTATLLNTNVTTFTVDKAQVLIWSNLSDNLTPAGTTYDWTVTWLNGAGTSLGTTVIRAAVNTSNNTSLLAMTTQSNGASATVSLGGAVSAGSFQTTTVTLNSIVCSLSAQIIDGSGWDFKSG